MASPIELIGNHLINQLAQLNAHVRGMGDSADRAINGFYMEVKRATRAFDESRGLRYRPATIQLSTNIVGAGSASSGSADFRVAQNEDFVVHEVRGFVMQTALPSEPVVSANLGFEQAAGAIILSPLDRLIMKAQNCRVTILNKDSKVPITENEGISLASITPEANGLPMRFGPDLVPNFIIPHNTTIQAQFAIQSTNAIFNTAATYYGVALVGAYVSREFR